MWNELWGRHRWKLIGAAAGLFFGFIYLIWGFWDMLVVAFLVTVGAYIGAKVDRGVKPVDIGEWYRLLTDRWPRWPR